MTAPHNQISPFADGPAANDAAEGGADERTPLHAAGSAQPREDRPGDGEEGTPIPSRFGTPLARMLPIPQKLGHPLPSTSSPAPAPVTAPAAAAVTASPAATGPADESAYADTFYGQIGGHATFEKIIHVFYEGIAADPLLRAMYAEEDLGPAERRMLMFMEQYWGGPRTYLEERGHPRLRMRHVPFAVTPEARDRWLAAMRKGVDAAELPPLHDATLWDYLERAAASLVNAPSDPSQRA